MNTIESMFMDEVARNGYFDDSTTYRERSFYVDENIYFDRARQQFVVYDEVGLEHGSFVDLAVAKQFQVNYFNQLG